MLKLNRKIFFAKVRNGPFPGRLTQSQVEGMNNLLDVWEEVGTDDPRHLAYTFATDFLETGSKMQAVREGFNSSDAAARKYVQRNYGHKGKDWYCWPAGPHGHVYYGRGDVQLTWYDNYVRMGKILGLPLVEKPDLALDPKISKHILVEGMLHGQSNKGDFTGHALEDYFNASTDDPVGARRIVNGTDKAKLIASYYDEFLDAIEDAILEVEVDEEEVAKAEPVTRPKVTDETSWGVVLTALGGVSTAVGSASKIINGPWAFAGIVVIALGVLVFAHGRREIVRNTGE